MTTPMTAARRIKKGIGMIFPNVSADDVFFWANWILVAALIIGVLATYAIVVSGIVRDKTLKLELSGANERAANAELRAAEANARVAEAEARVAEAHARSEERRVGKECRSRWSP